MRHLPGGSISLRLLLIAGVLLGSAGCARLFSAYDLAPNGLARRDDDLRRLLESGRPDSALIRVAPRGESAPEDDLLRALYSGTLAHYAGDYESSGEALQRAADLADDRYTKRLSRAALSLISNDKVLPYEPGATERLLIHYYAALNFLHQGAVESATVEARRLSALLERGDENYDREVQGWLRYFSGVVFEAAGEWNDADVAYRNARALLGSNENGGGGVQDPRDEHRPPPGWGEVVVLVEEGFVAHRVEQAIVLPLHPFEMDRLSQGESGSRFLAAAAVTSRVVAAALSEEAARGRARIQQTKPRTLRVPPLPREVVVRECAREEKARKERARDTSATQGLRGPIGAAGPNGRAAKAAPTRCADTRNPYLLKIAWPVYRQERTSVGEVRVVAEPMTAVARGETTAPLPQVASVEPALDLRADLSTAVHGDFEGERRGILARTILRGVAKATLTRGLERATGDEDSGVGQALGLILNLGTALLEQADTRSWQLLPDRIRLVRLHLPPGEHQLRLEAVGPRSDSRPAELGTVRVRAGEVSFLSGRIWH